MMDSKITLINDLDKSKDSQVIKVRIIRTWKLSSKSNPNDSYATEMLLLDEQIQATISKRWLPKFKHLLDEGNAILMSRFVVDDNNGYYKYCNNKFKLSIWYNTKMSKTTAFTGSLFGISLVPFKSVLDISIPDNVSFDIMGVVTNCDKILSSEGDNKKTRMSLTIKDLDGEKVEVTMWEPYVTQIAGYYSSPSNNGLMIILLQFARFNHFNGKTSVANSYDVTRLFINSDIEEINSFKNSLMAQTTVATSSTSLSIGSILSYSIRNDFLSNSKLINIVDIFKIEEIKSPIILATIKSIQKDNPWYYMGCQKCSKKAKTTINIVDKLDGSGEVEERESYECFKCVDREINVLPRYKIQIIVEDGTGNVALTLFDREGSKVLKKSAYDFYQHNIDHGDKNDFPSEIDYLVGKKYAFKIDITDYNLRNDFHTYGISKLTDNEEILSELQQQSILDQPESSESFGFLGSQTTSVGNNFVADEIYIGENVNLSTPMSKNVSGQINSMPVSIKRKVEDVNVDDDAVQLSTTKKHFVPPKMTLLTLKTEK